jgi:S1-C subfamily serine protease
MGAFVYFEEEPGQALKPALVVALTVLINVVSAAQAADTVSGSGVIISVKGEILTNDHVVGACKTITVKLTSGNSETAAMVERDQRDDLAVVRLTDTNNLPTSVASFREGIPLRAGDAIVALGYPLSWLLACERFSWQRERARRCCGRFSLSSNQRAGAARQQRWTAA